MEENYNKMTYYTLRGAFLEGEAHIGKAILKHQNDILENTSKEVYPLTESFWEEIETKEDFFKHEDVLYELFSESAPNGYIYNWLILEDDITKFNEDEIGDILLKIFEDSTRADTICDNQELVNSFVEDKTNTGVVIASKVFDADNRVGKFLHTYDSDLDSNIKDKETGEEIIDDSEMRSSILSNEFALEILQSSPNTLAYGLDMQDFWDEGFSSEAFQDMILGSLSGRTMILSHKDVMEYLWDSETNSELLWEHTEERQRSPIGFNTDVDNDETEDGEYAKHLSFDTDNTNTVYWGTYVDLTDVEEIEYRDYSTGSTNSSIRLYTGLVSEDNSYYSSGIFSNGDGDDDFDETLWSNNGDNSSWETRTFDVSDHEGNYLLIWMIEKDTSLSRNHDWYVTKLRLITEEE